MSCEGSSCGVGPNRSARFPAPVSRTDRLVEPERLFGEKYAGGCFGHDGRHAWLRVVPEKITSWDFRKMGLG